MIIKIRRLGEKFELIKRAFALLLFQQAEVDGLQLHVVEVGELELVVAVYRPTYRRLPVVRVIHPERVEVQMRARTLVCLVRVVEDAVTPA